MAFHFDLSLIALIGIILLIGIVKRNVIMLIDFALEAERHRGMTAHDAIYQACMLRFRPILMTTMAALLGAVPLMVGTGTGSETRQPLGYAHRRRSVSLAIADAVHDAGGLSVPSIGSASGFPRSELVTAQARMRAPCPPSLRKALRGR